MSFDGAFGGSQTMFSNVFCQLCSCPLQLAYDSQNAARYYCSNCNTVNSSKCEKSVQTDLEPLEKQWKNYKETLIDENVCSVCLEPYGSDAHRVVALKCGHLFGDTCISRWLSECKTDGGSKCPTCKTKAKISELRVIQAAALKKVDPEVIAKLQVEADRARLERLSAESQLAKLKDQVLKLNEEFGENKKLLEREEQEYARLSKAENDRINAASVNSYVARAACQPLVLSKRTDLDNKSFPRVLTVSDMLGVIIIAQRKENFLFPPYGLRNIGSSDLRQNEFIPLHNEMIKDIAFHPYDAMVLSASLDKTVKLTNIFTSSSVMTFPFEEAAWSVCWNETNPTYFYVGLKSGKVFEFDMRLHSRTTNEIPIYSKTPCISLKYVYTESFSGLSSTRLRGSEFHLKKDNVFQTQELPVSGIFMSSHFDRKTANLLLSNRQQVASKYTVSHSVFRLNINYEDEKPIQIEPIHTFPGGTRSDIAVRGRIFPHPNKDKECVVCAGEQDIGGFIFWSTATGECIQKVGGIGPVYDIGQINSISSSTPAYIALTDKSLLYYNWRGESW